MNSASNAKQAVWDLPDIRRATRLRLVFRQFRSASKSLILTVFQVVFIVYLILFDRLGYILDIVGIDEVDRKEILKLAVGGLLVLVVLQILPWLTRAYRAWNSVFFPFALHATSENLRYQVKRCIRGSRPERVVAQEWVSLQSAVLRGFSHREEMRAHFIDARDQPLVPCTYRCYARAVAELLIELQRQPRHDRRPRVWTVFRRPVLDWFNPFSVTLRKDGDTHQIKVTTDWWESYKVEMKGLANGSAVQVRRLVAHPKESETFSPDPSLVFLEGNELHKPLPLADLSGHDPSLLHGSIAAVVGMPPTSINALETNFIRLTKSDGERSLLDLFLRYYHSTGPFSENGPGAFVRFISRAATCRSLLRYDDLFVVQYFDGEEDGDEASLTLGLAYVSSEVRDQSGMWLVAPGALQDIVKELSDAWSSNGPDFEWCTDLNLDGSID